MYTEIRRRHKPNGRADQGRPATPSGEPTNRRPPMTQHRLGDPTRMKQRPMRNPNQRPHTGRGRGQGVPQRRAQKTQPPKWHMASLLKDVKIGKTSEGEAITAKEQFVKVRKVESGDSLFIQSTASEKAEKIILDGISAGKVTRGMNERTKRASDNQDDLFAWEAREYLRELLIGKLVIVSPKASQSEDKDGRKRNRKLPDFRRVRFRVKICHPNMVLEHDEWKDVGEHMIEKGWARKKTKINEEAFEEGYLERLEAAQMEARKNEQGQFQPRTVADSGAKRKGATSIDPFWKRHIRVCDWNPSTRNLFENFRGKSIPAIIDDVIAGSTVRLELLLYKQIPAKENTLETAMVVVDMSGLDCPRVPSRKQRKQEPSERDVLAREAQQFTFVRLCHRNVNVVFDWIDNKDNLYATIEFPRGDIAQLLLSGGYAKVLPWSLNVLDAERKPKYKNCEQVARSKKRRMWKLDDERDQFEEHPIEDVEVVEVVTGDQIHVKFTDEEGNEQERRVFFASIRAPRIPTRPKSGSKKSSGYEGDPYGLEAKEFVRANLIRKRVKIQKEYSRETRSQVPSDWVTVYYTDKGVQKNMNVELCKQGLAELAPHSRGERRATNFAELQEAIEQAENKKLNRFSDVPYQRKPLVDFTTRPKKSEIESTRHEVRRFCVEYLGFDPEISRRRRERMREEDEDATPFAPVPLKGIIEYIISGGRVKISLPELNTKITLVTSGIQVESKEKLGDKARTIMQQYRQQQVVVEIERCDRNNNFIGHIRYGSELNNLSIPLLKQGLAKCQWQNLEGSAYKSDFKIAEEFAKEGKVGVWENWEPPKPRPPRRERIEADDLNNEELDENGEPIQKERPPRRERRDRRDQGDRRDRRDQGDRRGRDQGGRRGRDQGDRRGRDRGERGRGMGKGRGRGRREDRGQKRRPPRNMKVSVTHVVDGTTFFARKEDSQEMADIENYLKTLKPQDAISENFDPKRDDIVAGLFEDESGFGYHRVLIRNLKGRGKKQKEEDVSYQVRYVDYGTQHELKYEQIIEIADERIRNLKAQAVRCELAGLIPPPKTTDYYKQAENLLWNEISEKVFDMEIVSTNQEDTLRQTILYHEKNNLNDYIVQIGYARAKTGKQTRGLPDSLLKKISEMQKGAKEEHIGMWRYGDLGSDDEK